MTDEPTPDASANATEEPIANRLIWLIRLLLISSLLAACVWVIQQQIPNTGVGVDDANIYLVYAKHLAAGQGVVFNVGGERVEGFSDPLWVLIAAVFSAVANDPNPLLLAFNVALVALTLALLAGRIDEAVAPPGGNSGGRSARLVSLPLALLLAWCLASPGYVCWTTVTLMDTGLWSALLIASVFILSDVRGRVERFARWRRTLALLVVGLILCRSEAPLWAGAFLAFGLSMRITDHGQLGKAIREMALPLAALPATLAVGLVSRLAYFGHPLPNTYYAKVSPDTLYSLAEGWTYLTEFLGDNFFTAPLAIAAGASACVVFWRIAAAAARAITPPSDADAGRVAPAASELEVALGATSLTVVLGLATAVLVGGDHFGSFRFYQPIWPVLPVPAALLALVLARRFGVALGPRTLAAPAATAMTLALAGVLALLVHSAGTASWRNLDTTNLRHEFAIAVNGRYAGEFLHDVFSEGELPRVGVIASGGIKVGYPGEVVDLAGLNHVGMGHSDGDRHGLKNHAAFSKAVFYELLPDLILPPSGLTFSPIPSQHCRIKFKGGVMDVATKSLFQDERFNESYSVAVLSHADETDSRRLCAVFRNDFIDSVERSSTQRGHRIERLQRPRRSRQPAASS